MARLAINYASVARGVSATTFAPADGALVARFGLRADRALRLAIRGGTLGAVANPDWAVERDSVRRFSGVDGADHCLAGRGHDWLRPLERQATEGFAYFLSSGSASVRRGRALAFLRSLDPPPGMAWPERVDAVSVLAEHKVSQGRGRGCRVDLMVVVQDREVRMGAVIEAKFDHDLSANPLGAYLDEAGRQGLDPSNCSFLVLGVRNDPRMRKRLADNPRWKFQSWRRQSIAHERELAARFDDDDYRRFRRTVGARAQ